MNSRKRVFLIVVVHVVAVILALGPGAAWAAERPARLTVVSDDNYPPYIFRDESGELRGILVDSWRAWEEATGVAVRLEAMDWDKALAFMREGKADVIDTMFFNEARAKLYAFSKPYARIDVPVFLHESLSGITDLRSLRGFTIGVKKGDAVVEVLKQGGIETIKEYPSYLDIIEAARQADLRVFSIDAPPALHYLYKYNLASNFRSSFILYSGEFHRAVRKEDAALLKLVEDGFAAIPAARSKAITTKWLGTPLGGHPVMRYAGELVLAGLAGIFVLGVFTVLLRRQVVLKTAALNAALEELRRGETKYRNVIENASEVIYVAQDERIKFVTPSVQSLIGYAQDERIKFVTPSVQSLIGYAQDEVLGRVGLDLVHPDDKDEVRARHRARIAGEAVPSRNTFRLVHKSGEVRHVALSMTRIEWDGRPATLNFLLDITDRVAAEEALQHSERKLRSLFASMTDVILVFDAEGRYVDIAPTQSDLLYRPPQELIGKKLTDLFPPPQAEFFLDAIHRALAADEPISLDYSLTIGGSAHWFAGTATRFSENSILWVARDITDRKLAEENLRQSEQRFRFILNDISHIAIQGYDEQRRVIFWNEASEHLYGYTEAEARGARLEDLIIPVEMRQEVISAVNAWVGGGARIPSGELELRHKNGGLVPVYSAHVMYTDPLGQKEMFCVDLDLTSIKRMQREVVAAKDRAEAANRAKSEFLANMSHEIRTPLNGVMSMLQLLHGTDLGDEQREYVGYAVDSSARLTRLLSDILDLSRIESNKLSIQTAEFSLREVLDAVRGLFELEARTKGVRLSVDMDAGLPEFYVGDEHRLRQVLFNLVGNALKFTPTGAVSVLVQSVSAVEVSPARLLFTVADTGIGIAEDQVRIIFEPFSQGGASFVRGQQGAGLGLAIVKRLVGLMGGRIYVESVPGEGTEFSFCLPLGLGDPDRARPVEAVREEAGTLDSLRILLAEDDRVNQLAMTRILEKAGGVVTVAHDGREALAALEEHDFDVVLMDIQMPVMDGLEATRSIRESERLGPRRRTPIIALTAYAMAGDKDKFLRAGMDGYLAKPVGARVVGDLVRQLRATR